MKSGDGELNGKKNQASNFARSLILTSLIPSLLIISALALPGE